LGEMIRTLGPAGVNVPAGFATTAQAYWDFLDANRLRDPMKAALAKYKTGKLPLPTAGKTIRSLVERAEFPPELASGIRDAYRELSASLGQQNTDVAVRSSATAEDLPNASFAGQQETFL